MRHNIVFQTNMRTTIPFTRFTPEYAISGYSPKDALSFCLASKLAYSKLVTGEIDRDKIRRHAVDSWKFSKVESFEIVRGGDIDTQGYIAIDDKRILAAFRGTESLPDWLTNLQAVRDPGPWADTKVHEGFQDAFMAAALKIGEIIGRKRASHEVWLTGHSLGGALAVLLAATLRESGMPVHGLYTFGAPRVGDENFAELLNDSLAGRAHWRVANQGDLIPHVPPESFFSHAGHRKLLLDNGAVSDEDNVWDDFKEDIWGWFGRQLGRAKLKIAGPHLLDSNNGYLQRLAAQCPPATSSPHNS